NLGLDRELRFRVRSHPKVAILMLNRELLAGLQGKRLLERLRDLVASRISACRSAKEEQRRSEKDVDAKPPDGFHDLASLMTCSRVFCFFRYMASSSRRRCVL